MATSCSFQCIPRKFAASSDMWQQITFLKPLLTEVIYTIEHLYETPDEEFSRLAEKEDH